MRLQKYTSVTIVRIVNYIPKKTFLNLLYQINQFDSVYLKNTKPNGPFFCACDHGKDLLQSGNRQLFCPKEHRRSQGGPKGPWPPLKFKSKIIINKTIA